MNYNAHLLASAFDAAARVTTGISRRKLFRSVKSKVNE